VTEHPLFVLFFMAGALLFFAGLGWRFFLYWRADWEVLPLLRGVVETLFSKRILRFMEGLVLDGILQRRLWRQDRLRWLMKVLIMVGYPGILVAGHLKAEVMPQFEGFPLWLRFLYAPFCDFFYMRDLTTSFLSLRDALFAISFDLFGAMILAGEIIALYRRFIAKVVTFETSLGDIVAVNLLGGWFILRFFCEAISILTYSVPSSVACYWFVAFGLSKVIAPLGLPWVSLNGPSWALAGFFLGSLVGVIPFNKKLWHILTIPAVMFANAMPPWAFRSERGRGLVPLSPKDLLALDACVKCGSCVEVCPVFSQTHELGTTMGGLFGHLRSLIRGTLGFRQASSGGGGISDVLKTHLEEPYLCTLCGRCELVCPALIETKELRTALRGFVVEKEAYPEGLRRLRETLQSVHNILGEPNEERALWAEALGDDGKQRYEKEKAEVVYFVGCVASYFPMTKRIPQALVRIFDKAEVDFTLLGGKEWCCGFPLLAAGMRKDAKAFMEHNLREVQAKGAKSVVFACPSCYRVWSEEYGADLELFHSTQFLKKLIDDGKIAFEDTKMKVTYHDPCDLGRASGVYEAPREILRSIPGVELVEMKNHGRDCTCCGGGGDLEMVRPALTAQMAQAKIEEILATGANRVITACQQCVRTIQSTARRKKVPIEVMDISEFVWQRMKKA